MPFCSPVFAPSAPAGNRSSSFCRIRRVSKYTSRPMDSTGMRRYATPSALRSSRGSVVGCIWRAQSETRDAAGPLAHALQERDAPEGQIPGRVSV